VASVSWFLIVLYSYQLTLPAARDRSNFYAGDRLSL